MLPVRLTGGATLQAASYPPAPRSNAVDEYHGVRVSDPYRDLEEIDAPATRRWLEAQSALTEAELAKLPLRTVFRERLRSLVDYERIAIPHVAGGRYFYTRNEGLQNQSILYVETPGEEGARVVLDPNGFSADGTVALSGVSVTDDGARLAYATSSSGSDWQTWRVREIASGEDRPDVVQWSKFSGATWRKDGSGFYYCAYPAPEGDVAARKDVLGSQRVYFHRLGTPQSEDPLVFESPENPGWFFATQITDDGRYLVLSATEGTDPRNRLWIRDLERSDAPWTALFPEADAAYEVLGNDGARFYVHTDRDAPNGKIIATEIERPASFTTLVAQREEKLDGASIFGDRMYATYLRDVHSEIRIFNLRGEPAGMLELPGFGTASGLSGERDDRETFYEYSDITTPSTVFHLDLQSGKSTIFHRARVAFDPSAYRTEQVFFTSADGTRVPMFVTAKRDLPRDGNAPTILLGYGGFDHSLLPQFSASRIAWLERGGVYAIANLRGGGEYGEAWHRAGMREAKQRVFDDFIAAAEYLIAQRYTSSTKLAILGGSNGGLLVGAVLTQRPDLIGAAIAEVGVLDMLRYQRFTVGAAWIPEFGSSDEPELFPVLYAYSPLHRIAENVAYPPTLITTGDHDDRVFPAHSFKFAAALQDAQRGSAPVLLRVDLNAGHGGGKPTMKAIEESADVYAFAAAALGMT